MDYDYGFEKYKPSPLGDRLWTAFAYFIGAVCVLFVLYLIIHLVIWGGA